MTAERELKIPLSDGKIAHAKLRGKFTKSLVIFAHGLTGSMEEILPYEASKFFTEQGFSFLRFDFYSWLDDGRKLGDCTLFTHASDLDDVVEYAKSKGAPAIYVIGHSYGGTTALLSRKQGFDAAILLDPSHPAASPFTDATYIKALDAYIWHGNVDYLISQKMVQVDRELTADKIVSNYQLPTLIISAGNGSLIKGCAGYTQRLQTKTSARHLSIAGADHRFSDENKRQEALEAALIYLREHESRR
jgi:pimeloyl-ACP methyl ester carboxylesterase